MYLNVFTLMFIYLAVTNLLSLGLGLFYDCVLNTFFKSALRESTFFTCLRQV